MSKDKPNKHLHILLHRGTEAAATLLAACLPRLTTHVWMACSSAMSRLGIIAHSSRSLESVDCGAWV